MSELSDRERFWIEGVQNAEEIFDRLPKPKPQKKRKTHTHFGFQVCNQNHDDREIDGLIRDWM
ncbi:MAG: hypothetical protein KGJ90_02220 [Patescibacteria group bacterium]|nr:hypothetical protein [Patescibacteria group bacterium]